MGMAQSICWRRNTGTHFCFFQEMATAASARRSVASSTATNTKPQSRTTTATEYRDTFLTSYILHGTGYTYATLTSGAGDGSFQIASYYSPDGRRAVAGDFNGDDLPDVIFFNDSYYKLYVLLGGRNPDLTLTVTDGGGFTPGQQHAEYVIRVTNSGTWPSSGAVQVSAALSGSVVATSMTGNGWTCNGRHPDLYEERFTVQIRYLPLDLAQGERGRMGRRQCNQWFHSLGRRRD